MNSVQSGTEVRINANLPLAGQSDPIGRPVNAAVTGVAGLPLTISWDDKVTITFELASVAILGRMISFQHQATSCFLSFLPSPDVFLGAIFVSPRRHRQDNRTRLMNRRTVVFLSR